MISHSAPILRPLRRGALALLLAGAAVAGALAPPALTAAVDPVLWPEEQRAFLQDGPALLFPRELRDELAAMAEEERGSRIRELLARDPIPETGENELAAGIERRRRLVAEEFLSPHDVRAELLFLHGVPEERTVIDCGVTFVPIEVWSYATPPAGTPVRELVLYRPAPTLPFRLWLPIDSKRVLYTDEMEYWLEQFEELRGQIRARRFDLQACEEAKVVDDATGVEGLFGFRRDRPTHGELTAWLEPPEDLAAWARRAAATPLPERAELPVDRMRVLFPESRGQRIVARFVVTLPRGTELEASETETEGEMEARVGVDGFVEQDGEVFDRFRVLFRLEPAAGEGHPIALVVERPLRPERAFLVRLRVRDDVSGATRHLARGFRVPGQPERVEEPPVPDGAVVALAEELGERRIAGADSLVLVPPETDVVLGLWRAEALVTGERIEEVAFSVDGEEQLTRRAPPFSVEVRLAATPREQVVTAEGFDEDGELVASDEVVLNQPTGSLRVRILQPARGVEVGERVTAQAEVVVPEGRRVERVEMLVDEELQATLERPPWEGEVEVPAAAEISYLTVVAVLDDGSRAEDVRFLRAPRYLEQVDVNLVELYTTVTDRSGRLVKGLSRDRFRVLVEGEPEEIVEFELVEDLPLTLGITIDTSGSMAESLHEAQVAARAFLDEIITPRDRYFVVSFAERPELVMPPTDDVAAIEGQLESLLSVGWTALHDAVVTSLYYFRGVRGRRALVLLSDGDDTASSIAFRDALEYARRSGVAIYTVGLDVGALARSVRGKLKELAEETGGRSFFIRNADELATVYDEIEEELRSQYLIAIAPEPGEGDDYREVEVEVEGRFEARTIRGYYP